jgi:MFS superfamily sulfate permease-like transporter
MKVTLPIPDWLKRYESKWLRGDALAGLTLAAYLLPAGLGDASLANLPPEAGLYACLFSGLVFWLFCSSRHTAVTVTSAISLLVGASLGDIAGGDTTRFGALAAGTALLVAALAFLAWLAKAGSIVNFISESVMVGFKCGVALYLASTQLPKLFGIHGAHGDFWENSGYFLKHLHETNPASLAIGGTALAVLVLGRFSSAQACGVVRSGRRDRGFGAARLRRARGKAAGRSAPRSAATRPARDSLGRRERLAAAGPGLLSPRRGGNGCYWPHFRREAWRATGRQPGIPCARRGQPRRRTGPRFPGQRWHVAIARQRRRGRADAAVSAVAAGIILVVVLFFSNLLSALPQPVLAAVVLVAVTGLFKFSTLKQLRHANRTEYVVAISALVGVLSSGLLRGVLIGAVISLVLLIRSAARPHVALLGRIPGTRRFSDRERHPDNELIPHILIFRPESGLFYFNMDHVRDTILDRVRAETTPPKLVVLDLSAAPWTCKRAHTRVPANLPRRHPCAGGRARSSVRERL